MLDQFIRWLSRKKPAAAKPTAGKPMGRLIAEMPIAERPITEKPAVEKPQAKQSVSFTFEGVSKMMTARQKGFAPTFGLPPRNDEPIEDLIFDPATTHYPRAFRRGDPMLPAEEMQRWQAARREAMWHLLDIVSGTEWAGNLVLRGSLSLKASLGAEAREPGDIDWVVQPENLRMDQPEAHRMMDGIVKAVTANAKGRSVKIDVSAILRSDIWTYDRAPGHRIAFPWSCGDLPPALVQMDFVFEQKLHVPPSTIRLAFEDLPEVSVLAASDEESLAWKLLWLFSDIYPQGKDLYDAVLLAERTKLQTSLLKTALNEADSWEPKRISEAFPFGSLYRQVDWENFQKECPWVQGTGEEWIARLHKAIAPVVQELCAEASARNGGR